MEMITEQQLDELKERYAQWTTELAPVFELARQGLRLQQPGFIENQKLAGKFGMKSYVDLERELEKYKTKRVIIGTVKFDRTTGQVIDDHATTKETIE